MARGGRQINKIREIQIDDSGWGSLIGGVVIGVLVKAESPKLYYGTINVMHFQGDAFKEQEYMGRAVSVFKSIEATAGLSPESVGKVYCCRGHVLKGIHRYLEERGYLWEHSRIKGMLQHAVEKKFAKKIKQLGIEGTGVSHVIDHKKMVAWLNEDFKNRKDLCKTGWKSFKQLEIRT